MLELACIVFPQIFKSQFVCCFCFFCCFFYNCLAFFFFFLAVLMPFLFVSCFRFLLLLLNLEWDKLRFRGTVTRMLLRRNLKVFVDQCFDHTDFVLLLFQEFLFFCWLNTFFQSKCVCINILMYCFIRNKTFVAKHDCLIICYHMRKMHRVKCCTIHVNIYLYILTCSPSSPFPLPPESQAQQRFT